MPELSLAATLRDLRRQAGYDQRALARAAGLALDTIRAYEQGKRRPSREAAAQLADAFRAAGADGDAVWAAAGHLQEAPLVRRIQAYRARPLSMSEEVAAYPWPCLVLNERHEVLAWNGAANAVAELDIGRDLATPTARNILRMAGSTHFEARLTNWDDLIGRLISVLKLEGIESNAPEDFPPYLAAVVADIARESPHTIGRIAKLWYDTSPFPEGARNVHPIRWKLQDGTRLAFTGVFRDWSLFDGTFAFDWHAADGATSAWLNGLPRSTPGQPLSAEVPAEDWPVYLRAHREEVHMSRGTLAARSGVSASSIYLYERGQRRPGRDSALAICRALSLDGYRINVLLRSLGYEEEPSDFARWLAGEAPYGVLRGHAPLQGRTWPLVVAESEHLDWPAFLLNGRCEIVFANRHARALADLRQWPPLPGRGAPHLLQAVVSSAFRERVRNWEAVATGVLPGILEPLVQGPGPRKRPNEFRDVVRHVREHEPAALETLLAGWEATHVRGAPRRLSLRIDWVTAAGKELTFDCLFSGLNSYDPYWVLDWHAADPTTHEYLAASG